MNDLHVPEHPVRFVTSSALFDGHDASINIMRRILQSQGAEVVHLGHNRAVSEIVAAALEEDVQGVAVSSYQGGHVEYFEYLVESLREAGAGHVKVFGGGGGVIVPDEIARLRESDVTIFSPEDGQRLGLAGMINQMIEACDLDLWHDEPADADALFAGQRSAIARAITGAETGQLGDDLRSAIHDAAETSHVPMLGITGTGGSGKSSLTDELVRRFRTDQQDKLRIAVLAIDPTRRKGGGALLGDRIRMNALDGDRIYFRSMATRGGHEHPDHLDDVIAVLKASGFDLVIIETPGIGQGDAGIVPFVDRSMYVMTPEFGAPSQLEKIDMLDFADVVAINKFERRGAKDALRDVGRQLVRNHEAFDKKPGDMPVFGTSAATFNDDGVTALYHHVAGMLREDGLGLDEGVLPRTDTKVSTGFAALVPPERVRYLAEIAEGVRDYHADTVTFAEQARRVQRLEAMADEDLSDDSRSEIDRLVDDARQELPDDVAAQIDGMAGRCRVVLRRRAGRGRARPGDPHAAASRVAVRVEDPARQPAAPHRPRRPRLVPASREPARLLPVQRGRVPVQARHRGRGPHVRRRGRPVPHQPAVQAALRGRRGQPSLHRLRLRDALRSRPRPAPRRLRQGRHVRRLGGDVRRHEGALRRVRPGLALDVGVHDDQRARAHRAGVLPEHRDRPGRRAVHRGRGS